MSNNICPACQREAREDDQFQVVQLAVGGMTHACRECRAKATGQELPDPVYPHGQPVPMIHDGMLARHIRVCGLCRKALRFSDPDKVIRVQAEDLCEEFQAAYAKEIDTAKKRFEAAVLAAEQAHAQAIMPFASERDARLAELDKQLVQDKLALEGSAENSDAYHAQLQHAEAAHAREVNLAHRLYEADTAHAKGAMEGAKFRASRDYRRAAIEAHKKLAKLVTPSDAEPGAYNVCQSCYAHCKPRIRERNVRTFVHQAHDNPADTMLL